MKKLTRYTVRFRVERPAPSYILAGLFDMLRYDNARVLDWSGADDNGYMTLTLEAERPEFRRWASMGIQAEEKPAY